MIFLRKIISIFFLNQKTFKNLSQYFLIRIQSGYSILKTATPSKFSTSSFFKKLKSVLMFLYSNLKLKNLLFPIQEPTSAATSMETTSALNLTLGEQELFLLHIVHFSPLALVSYWTSNALKQCLHTPLDIVFMLFLFGFVIILFYRNGSALTATAVVWFFAIVLLNAYF